jgi:hypothetical protein
MVNTTNTFPYICNNYFLLSFFLILAVQLQPILLSPNVATHIINLSFHVKENIFKRWDFLFKTFDFYLLLLPAKSVLLFQAVIIWPLDGNFWTPHFMENKYFNSLVIENKELRGLLINIWNKVNTVFLFFVL